MADASLKQLASAKQRKQKSAYEHSSGNAGTGPSAIPC